MTAAILPGEPIDKPLYIHRQSCYLFGRERRVADVPLDHPSISKQHAILQYRCDPANCPSLRSSSCSCSLPSQFSQFMSPFATPNFFSAANVGRWQSTDTFAACRQPHEMDYMFHLLLILNAAIFTMYVRVFLTSAIEAGLQCCSWLDIRMEQVAGSIAAAGCQTGILQSKASLHVFALFGLNP